VDMSISGIRGEIQQNLDLHRDVKEAHLLISGSIYTGVTEAFLKLEASRRGLKLTTQIGSHDDAVADLTSDGGRKSPDGIVLAPLFDLIVQDFEMRLMELSDEEICLIEDQFIGKWKTTLARVPTSSRGVILGLHPITALYPYWKSGKSEMIDRFNAKLRELVQVSHSVTFIDVGSVIYELGRENAVNLRMYQKARMPYTPELSKRLAPLILDALKIGRSPIKVLVLDCDNTIWGGVIGEERFDGILLDPNTPKGGMYRVVQRQIVELERLGMLVCLVSKNDEQDVLDVLDRHEYQVLRRQHLVSWRVNWEKKSDNLVSLASELDLNLSSFVFVDDSEFECAEDSRLLPDVDVRLAPTEPEDWSQLLEEIKRRLLLGGQEMKSAKTIQYQARREIETVKALATSDFEFLSTLNLKLKIDLDMSNDLRRLAEMFLKTNQFNLTTVRRSEREIAELMDRPEFMVFSIRVSDRFADHGLVSTVIAEVSGEELMVTDWLMSCRVLGRQIEHGIVAFLGRIALEKGLSKVKIRLSESTKNGRAIKFIEQVAEACNAERSADGCTFGARDFVCQRPTWITIEV